MAKSTKKAVQEQPAPAGHNVQDERAQFAEQTFMNVFRDVKNRRSAIGEEMGEINEAYKRLKPHGFTKGDIKFAFELEEKDSAEVIALYERRLRIAKMFGHGLARQFEMFSEDRTPIEDRAYEEGLAAGKLRKDAGNPYDMASPAGQRWQAGVNDGHSFVNRDLSHLMAAAGDELIKGGEDADPFADAELEAAE